MATEDWRSWVFRQRVQQQLNELIQNSPSANQRNAQELEAQVFQRATTRDEYLQFIKRIVMHIRGVPNDNMNQGNNPNATAVLNPGPGGTQGQMGNQGAGQPGQPGYQQPGGQFGGPWIINSMPRANVGVPPGMATRVLSPGFTGQTNTGPRPGPSPISGAMSTAPMPSNVSQPSPAYVPPSPSSTMVSSPIGMIHTPGQPQHPSPAASSSTEILSDSERAYRAKVQQLSKYVEPLRRMIQRIQDAEKLSKMKKLLDMLQNPQRRMPLETLIKCEAVLEKLEISRDDGPVGPQVPPTMDSRIAALLEAVSNAIKTPCGAHSLNRTISPALSILSGPTLCPPPIKKIKKDPVVQTPPETPDISDVVQGEVARLNSRFRVNVDCQQPPGSDDLTLICELDDPNLPCVPPIILTIPWDYPEKPPRCELQAVDYETTDFLRRIREVAQVRLRNLPPHCSLTMLLHSWEMNVRQACSPKPLTDDPVLNSFAITGF